VVNYHYNEYKIEPRNASDVSTTTGIASAPAAVQGFQVYPNPATDRVQWDLPAAAQADATWILFNAWGQPVAERAGINGNATWDVSGLAPGRYVLECRTPSGIFRAPFQKAGR
jgi:hypothetical protein